jgi:hypothetical protein
MKYTAALLLFGAAKYIVVGVHCIVANTDPAESKPYPVVKEVNGKDGATASKSALIPAVSIPAADVTVPVNEGDAFGA